MDVFTFEVLRVDTVLWVWNRIWYLPCFVGNYSKVFCSIPDGLRKPLHLISRFFFLSGPTSRLCDIISIWRNLFRMWKLFEWLSWYFFLHLKLYSLKPIKYYEVWFCTALSFKTCSAYIFFIFLGIVLPLPCSDIAMMEQHIPIWLDFKTNWHIYFN